jgi:Zn-dependent protease
MRLDKGGFRLFGLFGVSVFVHWSWVLVGAIEIGTRKRAYASGAWNVAEYLALFAIVLMHEFGHARACRSVGGKAERIVLWPLGGVAFVVPPRRPGAVLWSIAAGPLVNLVLVPLSFGLLLAVRHFDGPRGDLHHFVLSLTAINAVLLVFNLLPFYPLDGGQILRAILWFFLGPTRSLRVAGIVGLGGAGLLLVGALSRGWMWLALMAGFGGLRAWKGIQAASVPRREGVACPACGAAPPVAPVWVCGCGARFDAFATGGVCSACGAVTGQLACPDCPQVTPYPAWSPAGAAAPTAAAAPPSPAVAPIGTTAPPSPAVAPTAAEGRTPMDAEIDAELDALRRKIAPKS